MDAGVFCIAENVKVTQQVKIQKITIQGRSEIQYTEFRNDLVELDVLDLH